MKHLTYGLAAAVMAAGLAACGQSSVEPNITQCSPSTAVLQFAVGTANVAGTPGLNAVSTLRQSAGSGCSAGDSVLTNAPTIVGPAGFVVPPTNDAYTDAGTPHISGTLFTNINNPPPATTFDPPLNAAAIAGGAVQLGIDTATGINPAGIGPTGYSVTPSLLPYPLPFYAANNPTLQAAGAATTPTGGGPEQLMYIGSNPAFLATGHTTTQDGTFPGYYPGFVLGFDMFQATPTAGTYTLNVVIPTGITSSGTSPTITKTATSSITGATPLLATWATPPTFVPDGLGGGVITTNFAGAGTEEFVELVDLGVNDTTAGSTDTIWPCHPTGQGPYYYTFEVTPGTATITVPDKLGAAPPGSTSDTICTAPDNATATGAAPGADGYAVYGYAVDYPLAESAPNATKGQTSPTIANASGNADITTSIATVVNAPTNFAGEFAHARKGTSTFVRRP